MSGFENFARSTSEIEQEIERKGIVLGIDWHDEVQVRALAREALNHVAADDKFPVGAPVDHQRLARLELFGLAAIMLRTMEESAVEGFQTHGGDAWKAFGKALWAEAELRK